MGWWMGPVCWWRLLTAPEMVKGSRHEPSGHPKVNSLQETNQASLLFWFFFRQGHVHFPFPPGTDRRDSGFPPKRTGLFSRTPKPSISRILSLKSISCWKKTPTGLPRYCSPALPATKTAHRSEVLRSCSERRRWIPRHARYACGLAA